MNKVYEDAKDLHVRNTYGYVKAGDSYIYEDAAGTKKIKAPALKNLFVKGLLIVDGAGIFKPTSFDLTNGVATVTYVKPDAVTATEAVLTVLHSEEFAG